MDHIHTLPRLIEVSQEYKRPPPTRWSHLEERYDARRVPKAKRTHWATLARDRENWRIYWRPLESLDDQQDYRASMTAPISIVSKAFSKSMKVRQSGVLCFLDISMILNGLVSFAPFTLNGTNISECSSCVYLGREINQYDELLSFRVEQKETSGLGSFQVHRGCSEENKEHPTTPLRAHLFDSTVFPALTYASETWSLRQQDERSLSVIERAVERTMLGVSRFTQVRESILSSDLRQRAGIKDAVLYAKQSRISWPGHVMCMNDNIWTISLVTGFLRMSNVLQEDHRPDGQSSS
uniref:DUF1618 domain-containing protein n=1 Tax=Angiostrongylus cantonensis TaxID=6313 RepID=A0A0K0DDK6_ANGCA